MSVWCLADCMLSLEEDQDNPRQTIHSEDQLREGLLRLQQRSPGLVFLRSPDGETLEIAIGGSYAGLCWIPAESESRRRGDCVAVAGTVQNTDSIEFLAEGIPQPWPPEELLPAEEVLEAVLYFFREHRLPEWITWRQWNPTTKQWDTIPATRPGTVGVLTK